MTRARRWFAITLTLAVLTIAVGMVGCGGPSLPEGEPSIRGVVTAVTQAAPGPGGSVRIVWTEDPAVGPQAGLDAADARIDQNTALYRRTAEGDGELEPIEFDDLRPGDVVEAWFTGAVAESYPVQATASDVVVTGRYSGELPTPAGLEPEPAP